MALEAIADQPRAVELLRRALAQGRVAHAYAFVGPAGSGRTATALAFARALVCPDGGCGRCRACRLATARQHPDIHLIEPAPPDTNPKGPRTIRIAAVRELERRASLTTVMANRKVFVLDDAERMTGEAPQAFLKTLEEPPARTVVILVLPGVRALPATVLSRCQVVRFRARGPAAGVAERGEVLESIVDVRAKGADALFRRAQSFDRDREHAERFVDACWLMARDLLLVRAGAPVRLLADPAGAEGLAREAAGWSEAALLDVVATCRDARRGLAVNVTPRITVEMVLGRLARIA